MTKENKTLLGLPIVRVEEAGKGLESIELGDFSSYLVWGIRKRGFWRRLWGRLNFRTRSKQSTKIDVSLTCFTKRQECGIMMEGYCTTKGVFIKDEEDNNLKQGRTND